MSTLAAPVSEGTVRENEKKPEGETKREEAEGGCVHVSAAIIAPQ